MAKQNVTFFERHVEKIVVGVCGAVLAGAIALYGIRSPNRVTVGGESLGPSEFYGQFKEKGEQALRSMQAARAPDPKEKDAEIDKVLNGLKPPDYSKIPDQIAVAFVPSGPPVPRTDGPVDGKKNLAQILAPSKPILSTGRAYAIIPPPLQIALEAIAAPVNQVPMPQDTHWVTLALTIDRKSQREKFVTAEYNEDRMALRVTGLEVQRQMLLPGGEWGPVEKVITHQAMVMPPVLTLQIPDSPDDPPFFTSEQLGNYSSFLSKISEYNLQSDLFLRPPFQQFLLANKAAWWEWSIPRKLDGLDGDLSTDYGVLYPDELLPKKARRPAAPKAPPRMAVAPTPSPRAGTGARGEVPIREAGGVPPPTARPAATPEDRTVNRDIQDYFKKADKALNEENPLAAQKFLELIVALPNAPEFQKKKAQGILDNIKPLIETALRDREAKEIRRQEQMRLNFGPDIDPAWVTDTTVIPGKTYRYQVRLRALNSYAGLPDQLNQPKDAEKIELPGAWSAWSDPITVKPDREVFVFNMDGDKTAQIEIQRWTAGEWKSAMANKVGLGEPIVAKSGRIEVPYDGTIASIEPNRPYRARKVKDKSVELADPVPSVALILVDSRGEAHEHLVKEDADRRNRFNSTKTEEASHVKELQELQPSTEQPRGIMMPGGIGGEERVGFPPPMPGGVGGEGRNRG